MKTLCILMIISLSFGRDYYTMRDQYYFDSTDFSYQSEILLGQARVGKVNGNYWDVKIPLNRKSWALALAHGHQLIRNILKTDKYPIDIFLSTALKESDLGCDHEIVQENVEYPIGKQWDADDGFYQIEGWGASAYGEMSKLYPKRFPSGEENHGKLIGKDHFETATIGKVYYDLMVLHYWKYVNGYRPIELFDNAQDKGSIIKMLSAAFYMGHQTSGDFYKDIFTTNRDDSYRENDFLHFFDKEPYKSNSFYGKASEHAKLVHQCVSVFQDSAAAVGNPENNFFYSYYDSLISWNDFESYMTKLQPLYPEVVWDEVIPNVKETFDKINSGEPLSFRYQIAAVIDRLILSLPVENPVPGLKSEYSHAIQWHDSLEYEPDFHSAVNSKKQSVLKSSVINVRYVGSGFKLFVPYFNSSIVELVNARGQLIEQKHLTKTGFITISTVGLAKGVYFLKVTNGVEVQSHPLVVK